MSQSEHLGSDQIEWRNDLDRKSWDRALAQLGGHPLQSALWGDARRTVDGIRDHRWAALKAGQPIWMIRLEERNIPMIGRVAWVPRGPTGEPGFADGGLPQTLRDALISNGVVLVITDPWRRAADIAATKTVSRARPRTIWLDVKAGQEQVWNGFDSRFRQGVRRAQRVGIVTEQTQSEHDIESFFLLCDKLSEVKGFALPGSLDLMRWLLDQGRTGDVESRLFVARRDRRMSAGVFVMRCGSSTHYFWGATDRKDSTERVGEASHWAAIEWSISNGCTIHDLEGIDPDGNPGVYAFKKKFGGAEVTLAGKHYYPVNRRGQAIAWLDARFR